MQRFLLPLIGILFGLQNSMAMGSAKGTISGGQPYEIPDWFKVSFLDMKEESADAGSGNRGVMLFMHLDGCPYCARMLKENFRQGSNKEYIQNNFDVIAINIRGGREITWADGNSYTEKQLAARLKVHFTPTIVFLDRQANKVMQLNGYRKPQALRHAMQYVRDQAYTRSTLAEYIEAHSRQASYRFIDNPLFTPVNYLAGYNKPLAVIFEDRDCHDCEDFHHRLLSHPQVKEELGKFMVVRLDAYSNHTMVDVDGNRTSPRKWAEALKLSYRPGIILFNEGREQTRIDGRLYHFHFKEALRYVSSQAYRDYSTYNEYLAVRQQQLIDQGMDIDLSE